MLFNNYFTTITSDNFCNLGDMSSALLIAKYLGAEKQAELIENLLVDIQKENTENDHNVEVLIELLDGFNLDKYPQFYNQILNFCNKSF